MLPRKEYIKKYLGHIDKAKTNALLNKGINKNLYKVTVTPYQNLYKVKNKNNNTVGFIIGNIVFKSKS
jgi:hypothetical protein